MSEQKVHLNSAILNLSQNLYFALDSKFISIIHLVPPVTACFASDYSTKARNTHLPKTSSAKQQLVRESIQKRMEGLCKCAFDVVRHNSSPLIFFSQESLCYASVFSQDDERTSEYGSDNNSEFGVQNFEELLASAVIRQVALTTTTTPHTADGHSTVT